MSNAVDYIQKYPLAHIELQEKKLEYPFVDELEFNCNYVATYTRHIVAQVVDTTDRLIVEAVVNTAKEMGFTDLYILDKNFVMDALREKMEREGLSKP